MELRARRPRFGTAEDADAGDALDAAGQGGRLVRVGRAKGCGGVGVFAARSVPAGTVMTAYPFVRRGRHMGTRRRTHDADYEYEWGGGGGCGFSLDGHPELLSKLPVRRRRAGCGHLANDAIHREVTGRDNNCDFLEDRSRATRPRLHLVTTRAVRRGEELLVSYSFGYWLSRGDAANDKLGEQLREWLACHCRVRDALPHLLLHEYLGASIDNDHLVYMASCAEGAEGVECAVCGRGGGRCAPRRVKIRRGDI